MDDWRLVAGCADGTAKVADLRTSGITLHARTLLPAHRERVSVVGRLGGWLRAACKAGHAFCTARPAHPAHPAPCPRLQVWALALSETRLISAGLDGQVVVRSFLPGDVAAQEAGGHSESDEESSEDEGSLASAYTSSDSEEDSEEDAGWAGSSDSEGHDG